MYPSELETRQRYTVVAYERHDRGENPPDYEFLSCRERFLDTTNYERKLYKELALALDDASPGHDGVCVVAYLRADGADEFEDSSYGVIAIEQEPGRGASWHVLDEIAEQIQLY